MKINYPQLAAQLQKKLSPLYLVSGDEILFVQESIAAIRKAADQAGFKERKRFQVDNNFDWHNLQQEANHLSLFSENCLIELSIADGKLNDAGKAALESYAQNPPPDKILLIQIGKLDGKNQNSKWFKQVETAGTVVLIWPIENAQLPQWISQRLQQYGLRTDSNGLQLLAERTEGNLLATHQAIEKLYLLFGANTISANDIAAVITDSTRFDIFTLLDTILSGDAKRVIHIVTNLKNEDVEPTLILWGLARELRSLSEMANALATGQTLEQILFQYRVWEKRKPLIKRILKQHSLKNLQRLLQKASHIDRLIKGAAIGNIWDEFLQLSLSLAGIKIINETNA